MAVMKDVAARAHVSVTTVSHVLNKTRVVAPAISERVLAAAHALNYVPDPIARGLRTRRTSLIALVIPDISNPYFPEVARGAQDVADQHGYLAIVCNTDWQGTRERRFLDIMRRQRVEGVILNPAEVTAEELQLFHRGGIPIVLVGEQITDPAFDQVAYDNMQATRDLLEYLYTRGHRRIAHLGGLRTTASGRLRHAAYCAWLEEKGLPACPEYVSEGPFTQEEGRQSMCRMLRTNPRPTAIFAANDLMAIGAITALRSSGVAVPRDIAVVGFDNIDQAAYVLPPLTTVSYPKYDMGKTAAEILLQRVRRGLPRTGKRHMVPHRLVIRESA